jgi:outer membrane receptor protein involved in Fe transport
MIWLGQLTGLCAICLLLVTWTPRAAADEPQSIHPVPAIDAQPLPQALATFASLSHMQLVYVSQVALGKTSQAVSGGQSAIESLKQLLQGTGLEFSLLNDHTITLYEQPRLARAPSLPSRQPTAGDEYRVDPVPDDPIAEVVVTATKRNQMLSTVPMSITVLTPDQLDASGLQGIGGIAAVASGIEYDYSSQYGPGILTNLAIRGIDANKGDATTGIYVNDTPIQAGHTTIGNAYPVTFDLQQVEVLRGPQGVLFGRGAEGGAIRYITNEPSTTADSELYRSELSTTQHGGANLELGAAVGGPLVEGLLGARVSAWYRDDSGYVNRVDPFTGDAIDDHDNRSASRALRVAFAVEPTDTLRITPSFSHQSINLHDTQNFYSDPQPPLSGSLENGKLLRQPMVDDLNLVSLNVVDQMGGASLTSISSYVDRSASATVDTTNAAGIEFFGTFGNPLGPAYPVSYADAVPTDLTLHQVFMSQEVRLASVDTNLPLKWLGGLFYSRQRQDSSQDTYGIAAPADPGILTNDYNVMTEESAFGQAQWSLDPYWTLGAGMRVGLLQSAAQAHASGFANAGSVPFTENSFHERLPPTPRFDLSYQPDSRNLFYAAIAKGFRAGGGGGGIVHCGSFEDPRSYGPDSDWSFEVGTKNQLFDRRLHIDTSVYDIQWNDIQERVDDLCGNSYTTNIGSARSRGFDVSADAAVTDHLRIAATVGLIDVRYTRTITTADGGYNLVDSGSVVGGVPSVPAPWSGTVSARYEWPLRGAASVYIHGEEIIHSHNPGPFTELDPKAASYDPGLVADPATYLLNLQLGITRTNLNVHVFVNNVTNAQPLLQRDADAVGSTLQYAYTLRPRTLGILGTYSF